MPRTSSAWKAYSRLQQQKKYIESKKSTPKPKSQSSSVTIFNEDKSVKPIASSTPRISKVKRKPKHKKKQTKDITTAKKVITKSVSKVISDTQKQVSSIDKDAQYQTSDGTVVSGAKLQSDIVKNMVSTVKDITTSVKPGYYITSNDNQYRVDKSTAFLYQNAPEEERQKFVSSLEKSTTEQKPTTISIFTDKETVKQWTPSAGTVSKVVSSPSKTVQQMYTNLPPSKKEEYLEFTGVPLPERKYYPGYSEVREYIPTDKALSDVKEYLKSHPNETFPTENYIAGFQIGKYGSKVTGPIHLSWNDIQKLRNQPFYNALEKSFIKQTAQSIYYQPSEISSERQKNIEKFMSQGPLQSSLVHLSDIGIAGGETFLSPIILGEQVYHKYNPKSPRYISTLFSRVSEQTGHTPGLIGGTLDEGISLATGTKSTAYSQILKHPTRAFASTIGEIGGGIALGETFKPVKTFSMNRVIKPSLSKIPSINLKFSSTFKRNLPFYSKVSKTPTAKQIYRWSKGWKKGRVYKQLLSKQKSDIVDINKIRYSRFSKTEVFKPTTKTKWLSPEDISKFKSKYGTSVDMTFRQQPLSYGGRKVSILNTYQKSKRSLLKFRYKQLSFEAEKTLNKPSIKLESQISKPSIGSLYKPFETTESYINRIKSKSVLTLSDIEDITKLRYKNPKYAGKKLLLEEGKYTFSSPKTKTIFGKTRFNLQLQPPEIISPKLMTPKVIQRVKPTSITKYIYNTPTKSFITIPIERTIPSLSLATIPLSHMIQTPVTKQIPKIDRVSKYHTSQKLETIPITKLSYSTVSATKKATVSLPTTKTITVPKQETLTKLVVPFNTIPTHSKRVITPITEEKKKKKIIHPLSLDKSSVLGEREFKVVTFKPKKIKLQGVSL